MNNNFLRFQLGLDFEAISLRVSYWINNNFLMFQLGLDLRQQGG